MALFPGPGKPVPESKTNLDFTEARDSEWQWRQLGHKSKSAPRSRQITMPAPHHSLFYRPDALPAPNQQRQGTEGKKDWLLTGNYYCD